ncbi:PREDICTED: histone-lysine N-methyltransferase, H3 lysine-9 specific SUVH4-like [Ipomoea nil]|uniref:histone-lysine N-methyltransferase, H3 lysine-9 specific SUVH4-like n=1 Tax=Ipomoea nil TaxID=35883 RepID=UPI0009010F63|nr:PREDICTED: histone-lysine N-methyltransferase, H3 lysine-9 specific SUVH4-like [Ipomoea nil]XP_019179654.1 PREDICTED: histone-lysine N-methyltransferase, H3 lysine-9 specific SUVH4-like [Ipomoea nil]
MVMVSSGGLSHQNQKRPLENGFHSSSLDHMPKYKARKVSAVRDFPPGCGENAPQTDVKSGGSVVAAAGLEVTGVKDSDDVSELQSLEVVNCSVKLAVDESLDRVVAEVVVATTANGTLSGVEEVMSYVEPLGSDILKDDNKVEPVKEGNQIQNRDLVKELDEAVTLPIVESALSDVAVHASIEPLESDSTKEGNKVEQVEEGDQIENHDLMKEQDETVSLPIDETAQSDEMVPASLGKTCSQQQLQYNNSVEEHTSSLIKKKYRSRRVSAIRDFPPFCGTNAPKPIEENCMDIVKAIADEVGASIEKSEGVRDAEAVVGKEIVVYSQEEIDKCILPDDAIGLGEGGTSICDVDENDQRCSGDDFDSGNEVVKPLVQALMAEPLCPWRQGTTDLTSDGVIREGEVKKNTASYRKRSNAVAKKSVVRKASLFSIEARSGGECALVTSEGVFGAENLETIVAISEVTPQGSTGGQRSPEFDVTLQPFGSDDSRHNDAHGKARQYRTTVTKKVGHKQEFSRKALLKKRSVSKISDGAKGAKVPCNEDALVAGDQDTEVPSEVSPSGNRLPKFDVTLPPFGPNGSSHGDVRSKVRETLRLFQVLCRKLLQGEESKSRPEEEAQSKQKTKRIDLEASKIIKAMGKEVNTGNVILGEVPGVEVGDEFQYRVELALVGIHRLYQAGIDSMKHTETGITIAVSIVSSGAYADETDDPDVLIYSGQGGNVISKAKTPEDQKLERGNLALRNSITVKNPVRVIRGYKETKPSESVDAKPKVATTYVYDGIYTVQNYWTVEGKHGKMVFMFELRRIPGQADVFWKEVKSSKKSTMRHGVCVADITGGKELLPICAINRIDSEKPPSFNYIRKMKYPEWFHPAPLKGCDCTGKCSDSKKCACAVRNGGELPYNRNGAIVEVKPLVYECGPHCKCPPSCYNRVSQNGIKIQLEIFKTESRGWGVRSLTSIPSGTFICEYAGELLEDKEAERRIGSDEYLFDIGHNYSDCSINPSGQKCTSSEQVEEVGHTIDAAEYGNVGRFINHSCSPNLYAQNVLYDYDDRKVPHIMLFAVENISPLRELTYHYNYTVDQVRDSSGNIKVKQCFCGSAECTGRLY